MHDRPHPHSPAPLASANGGLGPDERDRSPCSRLGRRGESSADFAERFTTESRQLTPHARLLGRHLAVRSHRERLKRLLHALEMQRMTLEEIARVKITRHPC